MCADNVPKQNMHAGRKLGVWFSGASKAAWLCGSGAARWSLITDLPELPAIRRKTQRAHLLLTRSARWTRDRRTVPQATWSCRT
eukprot:5215964-Prymnesium_polylepis.1